MNATVDPNQVIMTGENSFIRLSPDGGQTPSDRFSHWRVLWCPVGAGQVLFAETTLSDGEVRLYSDNMAVARWLQASIECHLYPPFADTQIPVRLAEFSRHGTPPSAVTERVLSADGDLVLSWYDFIEPMVFQAPPGVGERPIGVFTTFFPAQSAQVELNGQFVTATPWPEQRGERPSSSACLAWSESWVKPVES